MKRSEESNNDVKMYRSTQYRHTHRSKTLHLKSSYAVYNLDCCVLNYVNKFLRNVDYEHTYLTWNLTSLYPVE